MSDFDPASRPSRAAWKDRYGMQDYLARQESARERRARLLENYRESLAAECGHGPRRRVIGQSGTDWWAGLACPLDIPNCGVNLVSPEQVYREWKDSQPEANPAGAGL
jgi:hypothetical protein